MDASNNEGKEVLSSPYFRIWTCGAFRVERRIGSSYEAVRTAEWGGSSYPRLLLKVLLCCPGRQARREALMERLWPEAELEQAAHYLNTATTKLRKVLQPAKGRASLLTTEDDYRLYRLEEQHLLWMDAGEALSLLTQVERLGRTSLQALPLLEQAASYLSQGVFLEEEEGLWASSHRAIVDQACYRCRIWLAEAYEQQGNLGQAEVTLSALLEADPIDEDVLCRLMLLLHRQGMTHRALHLYKQTCEAMTRDKQEPTEAIQQLATRLSEQRHEKAILPDSRALLPAPNFSETLTQSIPEIGANVLHNALLQQMLLAKNTMTLASNRTLFASTILPFGSFDSAQPLCVDETTSEAFVHFASLTNTARHLSEGNELQAAERTLWAYLPRVEAIAKLSFEDQQTAAALASQGYLLAASLAGHRNDLQARHRYSEQALLYGKLAEDRNLQIVALRQLSITFDYLGRPDKVLQIYQQAFPYLGEVSPLLRACVYAGVSGAYAQLRQRPEALHFMDLAYEHFPANPEREPSFLHTICRYSTLVFFDGLNYLDLGQPAEAEKVLARIDGLHPKIQIPERVRIEALNYQVEVFIALNAMEQACAYLEVAVQAALAIGSERRLQESFALFQRMKEIWPHESRVQALADLFVH